ncbi:ABC transporter permease [Xanthobacteraceae bacterium A53D]
MKRRLVNLLGIALVLLLWQVAGQGLGDALLATPVQAGAAMVSILQDGAFWAALWRMMWQMLIGYALALFIGIPLGIAMGRNAVVNAIVKPWASMCIVISAAAVVPLFIILMGRGLLFSVAIVFVVTVWYVVASVSEASRSVSPRLLNVALSFAASDVQRFRFVILPALHPYLMIAARVGFVHALRAMVTAEMFISAGYGGLLNDAGLDLSTAPLFALIVILMLVSITATMVMRWAADRAAPWYASRTRNH